MGRIFSSTKRFQVLCSSARVYSPTITKVENGLFEEKNVFPPRDMLPFHVLLDGKHPLLMFVVYQHLQQVTN